MGPVDSAATFKTTSWTLIISSPDNPAGLESLVRAYRGPIAAYLHRRVRHTHDAEELTQEFIRKAILEGNLLRNADRTRGRFRAYLMASLDRFLIDEHRKRQGRSPAGRPGTVSTADESLLEPAGRRAADDPAAAYNREFARTILDQVRRRLEDECKRNGQVRHWMAYEARVLRPLLSGCEAATVESLAPTLGATPPEVSHMIETVRRKSVKVLREVVADTIEDPSDLDDEIDALWRSLAD